MKIIPTHIFPLIQTPNSLSNKVAFTDSNGMSAELIVVFKIDEVSNKFSDEIGEIAHKKIHNLFENSKTFSSNYEMEITDKDFS